MLTEQNGLFKCCPVHCMSALTFKIGVYMNKKLPELKCGSRFIITDSFDDEYRQIPFECVLETGESAMGGPYTKIWSLSHLKREIKRAEAGEKIDSEYSAERRLKWYKQLLEMENT